MFCNLVFHTLQHFGPIPGEALKINENQDFLEENQKIKSRLQNKKIEPNQGYRTSTENPHGINYIATNQGYRTKKWGLGKGTEQVLNDLPKTVLYPVRNHFSLFCSRLLISWFSNLAGAGPL